MMTLVNLARCAAQISATLYRLGSSWRSGAYIKITWDIEGDVRKSSSVVTKDAALAADAEVLRHDEEKHQRDTIDDLQRLTTGT